MGLELAPHIVARRRLERVIQRAILLADLAAVDAVADERRAVRAVRRDELFVRACSSEKVGEGIGGRETRGSSGTSL